MLPGRLLAAAIAVVLLSEAEGTPNKLVAGGGSVTVTGGPSKCEKQNRVKKGDFIGIHYTGTIDKSSKTGTPGSKFDSSFDNSSPFEEDANKEPQPFDFTIGNEEVIDGWDFGLLGLCKGAKATLVVPPELGYGDRGMGSDIPGGATINFAVEVMSVGDKPKDDDGLDPTPWPPEPAHEHEEEAEEAEEHEEGDAFEEQEVEDPTLQEHEDMGDPIDPNQDSWWFEAHEKELAATIEEENPGAPGPITQMLDDFHTYTDAIRTKYENQNNTDAEVELLAKMKAQYPMIDWDKPGELEHIPEEEKEEYEGSIIETVHGHLDDSFYNAKDKEQADELLKFLETLAPGAVAKARKETERIANLTEEEYAMEFSMETMMGHDEL